MKLSSNEQRAAECKVLILYILNNIQKPVTNDTLLQLILSIDDMNYFYFKQYLLDLIENKYIIEVLKDNEKLYTITETGKRTLELTLDILPGIKKLKVDSKIKDELSQIEDSVSVTSEFEPYHLNEFLVTCKIVENSSTIFEVKTVATDREQAKKITENWEKNSEKIYPQILKILTQKKK